MLTHTFLLLKLLAQQLFCAWKISNFKWNIRTPTLKKDHNKKNFTHSGLCARFSAYYAIYSSAKVSQIFEIVVNEMWKKKSC